MRISLAILTIGAGLAVSRFVLMPLGEPSTVWLWCDMLSTCSGK